jgi:VWFA-related protein
MALHCGRASVVGAVLLGAVLAGWGQAPAANPAVPAPPGPSQPGAGQPVPADAYPQLRRHEDDPGFTLNVNAREVILDVIVTNARGQVVKRLQPGDLTLYEDGVPQKIVSFQQHEGLSAATAASLAGPKLPPNVFSNYIGAGNTNALTVILIDTQDTGIVDQAVVRANLISYMKSVPAGHPIAVFQFDTSMHLVQGFSSDPKVLLQAVESKRNDPRYNNVYGSRYDRFVERQESLFDGLETMARYLAGFPGHKNLIWFTGRLPIDNSSNTDLGGLFPDVESSVDFDASLGQASDLLVLSQISVYPVDTRGLRVDPAFTAASRGIPSLPASANFAIGQAQGHEELREVAEATGGKALFNDDGFKQFVDQVVENGSEYYRVAYTPSNTSMDGGYRKISIQLANRRLRAQYRHGYHAQYESTFVRRGNAAFATTAIEPKQTAWPL